PMTPMAFPPIVRGAVIGATTWVPPRINSSPVVTASVLGPAAGGAPLPAVTVPVPRTPAALPASVTGAVTGATACVPPPSDPSPWVVVAGAVDGAAGVDSALSSTVAAPRTPAALPASVTGAVTGATTCVPPP